ncbi:hypothetical protein N0V95_003725 [Ascochyta clinopodiicola]|nr:hypothetical protein N0V95_003725 [Ascochyta clinopodiicola]
MNNEFRDDPSFKPWGPLISPSYVNEPITTADIIVASTVFALTLINVFIGIWLAWGQSKVSRNPLRSVYVWMIWLELGISLVMGIECFMHLMKIIKPSKYEDLSYPNYLLTDVRYHIINEYWDRIEKFLYLIVDAALNWYFLKTVKANLISNGLTKYNRLVRFNQRIVVVSLLMDVMIIGAMSIPNSFVYIQFHPLAYLVKLNIEMVMANLIKRIAISASRKPGNASLANDFRSSNLSTSGAKSGGTGAPKKSRRESNHELASVFSYKGDISHYAAEDRVVSFAPTGNEIKKTHEVVISSEPNPFFEGTRRESNIEITGGYASKKSGVNVDERRVARAGSLESVTEGSESVKGGLDTPKRDPSEYSDDEALVGRRNNGW